MLWPLAFAPNSRSPLARRLSWRKLIIDRERSQWLFQFHHSERAVRALVDSNESGERLMTVLWHVPSWNEVVINQFNVKNMEHIWYKERKNSPVSYAEKNNNTVSLLCKTRDFDSWPRPKTKFGSAQLNCIARDSSESRLCCRCCCAFSVNCNYVDDTMQPLSILKVSCYIKKNLEPDACSNYRNSLLSLSFVSLLTRQTAAVTSETSNISRCRTFQRVWLQSLRQERIRVTAQRDNEIVNWAQLSQICRRDTQSRRRLRAMKKLSSRVHIFVLFLLRKDHNLMTRLHIYLEVRHMLLASIYRWFCAMQVHTECR